MPRPRAYFAITGSELVRGERTDRNGPWLAEQALGLGLEPTRIAIVGDHPDELRATLREGLEADLLVTSGGLGPTHDDRTVELVADAVGRELRLDEGLREQIDGISRAIAARMRRPYADFDAGVRKQATVPDGAASIGLAGTAPGLVLEHEGTVVVVLPGPPAELRRLWPNALETEPMRRLLARAVPPGRRVLKFFGASESAVARALAEAGGDGDGVEATICARDFEIHVDLIVEPGAEERATALEEALAAPLERFLFSRDGTTAAELVLDACRAGGLTLATAESCTGGMIAERLTEVPGSSDAFLGAVVAYANAVKERELGVPAALIAAHGAVSEEVAVAMAQGARERLGADVAVAVTGIAGPGGGTLGKPVGLVHVAAVGPGVQETVTTSFPGDRDGIRRRATMTALHLLRRLLAQSRHTPV
ncbi:MAG: CinA family nicotinamide mononucleotide deamidase-related protein [Pseudomonadota bacterium]